MIGVVVIGRNEGERLRRCLLSLPPDCPVVYVDSGSTDGSVDYVLGQGLAAIALDMSVPFTAARARNAGFHQLVQQFPQLSYVQFVDGDCELMAGWLDAAVHQLEQHPQQAVVCGRIVEKHPEASRYNRLADMEWGTPRAGEVTACGGIALMRISAVKAAGGFDPQLICGEEPELCLRLRRLGWTIWRLDLPMTYHDSDMHHFGQWWKRMVRGGWAVAEGFARYGHEPERYMRREYYSGWLWGLGIPLLSLLLALPTRGLSLLVVLLYPLLALRVYQNRCRTGNGGRGDSADHARLFAVFITLSKLPQMLGQLRYWRLRWQRRTPQIIEYKTTYATPQGEG